MTKQTVMLDDEDFLFEVDHVETARAMIPVSDTYKAKPKKERVMKSTGKKRVIASRTKTNFNSIQDKALAQAVNLLYAIRCEFRIVMPDGESVKSSGYASAKPEEPKLPYGSLAAHFRPYIEPLQIGDTAEVPFRDDINHSKMQSAMSAWMVGNWGKGSYTTLVNRTRKCIEVLRVK